MKEPQSKLIKPKKQIRVFLASLIVAVLFLQSFAPIALSDAPESYGRSYGILVHQKNQDLSVSKAKALQVLMGFFPNAVETPINIKDPKSVCSLPFLNCGSVFVPNKAITQKEFLMWFYAMYQLDKYGDITEENQSNLYNTLWLQARRNNWLSGTEMTYKNLREFLYRYEVSKSLNDEPYFRGLVLDPSEINIQNFSDLDEVISVQSDLFERILELKAIKKRSSDEDRLLDRLNEFYLGFKDLENEIKIQRHPLNKIKNLPENIKENIKNYKLNEVLAQISYDYSKNVPTRKHNLTLGLSKINGMIFLPGETFDFMQILSDKNWWDYKYGWVLFEGDEAWQLGGGLCGAATMIYTPSWMSGLQIIKRYPHSAFYSSLYPKESLGLDATIYRNSQKNLKIRNNTESPIMYYVENDTEKEVVTVYLIGNSPYKKIDVEGPIIVDKRTYKWIRHMQPFDGAVNTEELVTHYGAVY
jgi:hypothetical protein